MRHQQMVESNRVHSKRMILVKKEQILQKDWMDAFDEWHQSIKCIEECFSILFPSVYSHPNNRSDNRSDESACILPAVKGSTAVKAAEEEEVESDESLDEDVAMSPYHQDESGVEWVEGDDDDDDDDDAHGDGHGDQDDNDNNQKTKNDKFNANDDVDHHHLSTRQAYNLVEGEEEDEEEEFYGDESMPTGAVPYSLVSMLISS